MERYPVHVLLHLEERCTQYVVWMSVYINTDDVNPPSSPRRGNEVGEAENMREKKSLPSSYTQVGGDPPRMLRGPPGLFLYVIWMRMAPPTGQHPIGSG